MRGALDHDRAVIDQWPKANDPRESRIVGAIRDQLLRTNWAKEVYGKAADIQLDHLRSSLQHLDNPQLIHDDTQEVLAKLADLTKSRVVAGQEYLDAISKGQSVLLLTNHLGSYKLNSWSSEELKKAAGVKGLVQPIFYPFPLYYSAMYPVAKVLGNNLYIASFEYPGQLGEIFRATESIEVPPKADLAEGETRTKILIDSTRRLVESHPNSVIVSFPEGGTTGKRNGGGPYDLEEFHTGSYVIARALSLMVLPVAQYFSPKTGFELRIFEPTKLPEDTNDENIKKVARLHFEEELTWLRERAKETV